MVFKKLLISLFLLTALTWGQEPPAPDSLQSPSVPSVENPSPLPEKAADQPAEASKDSSGAQAAPADSSASPAQPDTAALALPLDSAAARVTSDSVARAGSDSAHVIDSISGAPDSWEAVMDSSADSLAQADTLKAIPGPADSAAVPQIKTPPLDEYASPDLKKKKVFRQSQINSIDEMKGKYKSPKKAMFMSLILPGLGQAYIGSYIRGAFYLAVEGGLALGWRHYVVTKHDRQVNRYRKFAAEHWSHRAYEEALYAYSQEVNFSNDPETMLTALPTREEYCNSLFQIDGANGSTSKTCRELGPYDLSSDYSSFPFYTFLTQYEEDGNGDRLSPEEIEKFREDNFKDIHTFYEIIGKHNEYLMGWDDADSVEVFEQDGSSNTVEIFFTGLSDNRNEYRRMRAKATRYSRMQSVFLGFMVLNHLVSAVDAALAARFHNKKLYETDVSWYDRLEFQSFLAFTDHGPLPMVRAILPF